VENIRNRFRISLIGLVPALLIGLDQSIKKFCESNLHLYQEVFPGPLKLISLTRFHNLGLIFGKYSAVPDWAWAKYTRYYPTAMTSIFLIVFLISFARSSPRIRWSYTLILMGGFSNLWDHWHADFVVDTFRVRLPIFHQTVPFNLADVYIWIGMLSLTYLLALELNSESSAA
jgi:lipoprotein signal peptidase